MSTAKRLALAFGSMVLAIVTLGVLYAVSSAVRFGFKKTLPGLEVLPVFFVFAVPGVILAAPLVVVFKDAAGRRLWWTLLVGIAIGPVFMVSWTLLVAHRLSWAQDGFGVVLSVVIGGLTTGFYVGLLRWVGAKKACWVEVSGKG